ncbi:MAG: AI-2E family transporter [Bacteroidetes bacterium]|nr:AI-2E family transporter [Bacteroidota bacterium]
MPGYFNSSTTSKTGLAILLVLLGGFIIYMLNSFVVSFLGALIFYVLFRPFMRYLAEKKNWNSSLSASVILCITFLVVLLPVFTVSYMIVPKLSLFFSDTSIVMQTLRDADIKIKSITGIQLLSEQNILGLQQKATSYVTAFFGASINMIMTVLIMYLMLFYMLKNCGKMETAIEEILPFSHENIKKFSHELKAQTFSNALGAPLYGLLQGIIAAIGYWIFGVNEPVFWGIMTGFFSFVPVVGSTAIWLPAAVIMISNGAMWKGVGLGIYGLIIISLVDNVFLMIFQKKFANVHPLVTILGFFLGIGIFGVPGIIFGPLLISYFLILLRIYKEEYISGKQKKS